MYLQNDFCVKKRGEFDHPVCSKQNTTSHRFCYFFVGHCHISISTSVFTCTFCEKKVTQVYENDKICNFFNVTDYRNFTHPEYCISFCHIWHPCSISFPKMYTYIQFTCSVKKGLPTLYRLVRFLLFFSV